MMTQLRSFASVLLGWQALMCVPAWAQNTLTVPMEVVRMSNPNLAADSPGSVTLYRLSPQYTLQSVQENSRTELSLGAVVERSSNTELQAHRTLPSVRVLWENSSPVAVLALRASLEEMSTQQTEFAEFGRVTLDSTERIGTIGGTWTRQLTANASLELSASHARVSYDTPLLIDYSETRAALSRRVELDANSRYSLIASASHLKPDGAGASTSFGEIALGYERALSERLNLTARAGAARIGSPSNSTHFVGALRLAYEGERLGYAVGWSRDVGASGALGGYRRAENFDASLTYPLSINTTMSVGVTHARSLDGPRDAGATAYARFRSELNSFWAFTLGLEHRRSMPLGAAEARGNVIAAGLVYTHPDF